MSWGKLNRRNRIFNPDTKKSLVLAIDHRYFLGAITGLGDMKKVYKEIAPHADAILTTVDFSKPDIHGEYDLDPFDKPIILRASGGSSIERKVYEDEDITQTVEQGLRLNVSALAYSVFIGTDLESRSIKNLAQLCRDGDKYGMPIMAVIALGGALTKKEEDLTEEELRLREQKRKFREENADLYEKVERILDDIIDKTYVLPKKRESNIGKNTQYLKLACEIAQAHGADLIKVYRPKEEDGLKRIVADTTVPVLIAGGTRPKEKTDVTPEFYILDMTYKSIKDGALGMVIGRNIFQSEHPVAMIKAISAVIHENYTSKQAYKAYNVFKKRSRK